jgi:RNA polymerase sigma-B factor
MTAAPVSLGHAPAAPGRLDQLAAAGVRPEDRPATDQVERWCRGYAETRDPELRERIILAYLGLADRLAARYRHHQQVALEDLRQAARVGLILAVDRYDPARGPAFVPYAVACVTGELKRHLRDLTWTVRVARPLKERALAVCRAMDELSTRLGREPTIPEVAAELALSPTEVAEALGAARSRAQLSLDQPFAGGEETTTLGDRLAAPGPAEEPEDLLALSQLVKELPDTERLVVADRLLPDAGVADPAPGPDPAPRPAPGRRARQ